MIKYKICMLGSFAVGKTSLVQRFVTGIFSDKYLTTIGVKIDKKTVNLPKQQVELLLWDIHGEDNFQRVQTSYMRGAAGYFLVVDGTRKESLDTAIILQNRALDTIGNVPYIVLLNKSDLKPHWEIDFQAVHSILHDSAAVIETSAKTGEEVENVFTLLTQKIMKE